MPGWIVTFFPTFSPSEIRAYVRSETDSTQNEILSLATEQIQNWQLRAVFSLPSRSVSARHGAAVVGRTGLAGASLC